MTKENKNRLVELALEANRKRYPNFPEHARPQPKYSEKNANSLTKCVIDFINLSGYQAERINNIARKVGRSKVVTDVVGLSRKIGSERYVKSQMTAGTADISATIHGRSVKIEVKFGKDRQSEAQKNYQKSVEAAGGVYILVKGFDSFVEWFDDFIEKVKN